MVFIDKMMNFCNKTGKLPILSGIPNVGSKAQLSFRACGDRYWVQTNLE